MPIAAPKSCSAPGCPVLTSNGRCDAHRIHQQRAYDAVAGTAHQRGYGQTWRDFIQGFRSGSDLDLSQPGQSDILLARNRCAHCWQRGIRKTDSLEYDHIIPLKAGGARLDPTNIQPLCDSCHRAKTWQEKQGRTLASNSSDARAKAASATASIG